MLTTWLSRLVATLLVPVLCLAIISTVLNQTIFTSHYLEDRLNATDGYQKLADGLSSQLVNETGITDPALRAVVKASITPALVRQRLNPALDQLQAYYEGKDPATTLDLRDIGERAQALGLPVSQDGVFSKPITLGSTARTDVISQHQSAGTRFERWRGFSIVTCVVLTLILLLLCWWRHNFRPLPHVLISVGVSLGLVALVCLLVPGIADHFIRFNTGAHIFTEVAHDLVASISKDLGKRFGLIALLSLLFGIIWRVLLRRRNATPTVFRRPATPSA